MKKTLMTVAVALSALVALPAAAQNPTNNSNSANTAQTCQTPGNCARGNQNRPDPYKGINLTPEQRTALDGIETSCRSERRQCCNRDARAERRQARREEAGQRRRNYLDQVKGVLTPDQYVVFLENIVLSQPASGHHRAGAGSQGMERRTRGRDANRHHAVNSSQMRQSTRTGDRN